MQNEKLQYKIDQTLNSINAIKKAEANPYLYTRIMEKLTTVPAGSFIKKWVLWPVSAALVIIIVLNIGILTSTDTSSGSDNAAEDSYFSGNSYNY